MRLFKLELEEKMTINKHVFKQTYKKSLSRTLSVSDVVHLYSFFLLNIRKTSEYDQEIPQSHTVDQDQA